MNIKKKSINKEVIENINTLMGVGNILANIAYNTKQRDDAPKDLRVSCGMYQKKWDEAYVGLLNSLK